MTPQSSFSLQKLRALRYELSSAYDAPPPRTGHRRDFLDTAYACWFVRRGQAQVSWADGRLVATKGTWVLSGPDVRRSQSFSAGAVLVSIRFESHWEGADLFHVSGPPLAVDARRVPDLLPAAERVVAAARLGGAELLSDGIFTPEEHAALQASLLAFVAAWHRALVAVGRAADTTSVGDPRLSRALDVLSQHEGLGVVPYAALSKASGLGRAQLDRLFCAKLGLTPRRYCERRCLRQAQRLLRDGQLSIKEIAARLAFTDSSHLAKWFRAHAGSSPLSYRRHSFAA